MKKSEFPGLTRRKVNSYGANSISYGANSVWGETTVFLAKRFDSWMISVFVVVALVFFKYFFFSLTAGR